MGKKKETHTGYRSAKTGEFITEKQAKNNPKTTVKERIPNPGKGRK